MTTLKQILRLNFLYTDEIDINKRIIPAVKEWLQQKHPICVKNATAKELRWFVFGYNQRQKELLEEVTDE